MPITKFKHIKNLAVFQNFDWDSSLKDENNEVQFLASGTCYFEMESGKVAKIDANFLGGDEPQLSFIGPSEEYLKDKIEFETSRIKKWFSPTTHDKK